MVGSSDTAGEKNGEATAQPSGSLRRFLFAAAALALLAACAATAPPPAASLQPAAAPMPHLVPPPKLAGLSAAAIVALLGEPDFRRAEPPAELWQYRSADCVLDLFLYGGAGGFHVAYSDTRERSMLDTGAGSCAGGGGSVLSRFRQTRL